jgi:hypothetical protein
MNGGEFVMATCIKCGSILPPDAKYCPLCGNPVSFFAEKKQSEESFSRNGMPPAFTSRAPVSSLSKQQARVRTSLIVAVTMLSVLLIASLVFAVLLWSAPAKLSVSSDALDYGTLQMGNQSHQVLTLSNTGRQNLDWQAVKGTADWLTLDPVQGRIPPGGSQNIQVSVDTATLTAGHYSASISVLSNGGTASVSATLAVASKPAAASEPVITSMKPTSGPMNGGTAVTIQGSGFTGASHVLFGATAVDHFTVKNDMQIMAVSPAGSGTVHVTVLTPVGTTAANTDQFTYLTVPKVVSIEPTSGPIAGGTTVIIRGSGFTGTSRVVFGTKAASNYIVKSDAQITAVSPTGHGTVHVTITTSAGTTATSYMDQFTYLTIPPNIVSVEPNSGPAGGGTTVTIMGTGFTGASQVLFGPTAATSYEVKSDTHITTVSPAGNGTVYVTVITPVGTTAASETARFQYMPWGEGEKIMPAETIAIQANQANGVTPFALVPGLGKVVNTFAIVGPSTTNERTLTITGLQLSTADPATILLQPRQSDNRDANFHDVFALQVVETATDHLTIHIKQIGASSTSPVTLRTILYEELNWWFGGVVDTYLRERPAQTEARFTALAEDLWMVYQRRLAEQAGHDKLNPPQKSWDKEFIFQWVPLAQCPRHMS